ncbi:MAG: hypothetical protein OQL19_11745 [Gammaproteobacteria bacterium]|nr:hypothetical protein [Gammaproteobacteria bacterium]
MGIQENNLTLEVNDVQVAYVPNSIKYRDGKGSVMVNVNAAGGGATTVTHSIDLENAKGMVSFQLRMTQENDALVRGYFTNIGANTIRMSNNTTGFTKVFSGMSLIEDPDRELSADGIIDLTFEGNGAVA